MQTKVIMKNKYSFKTIYQEALKYKKEFAIANITAFFAVLVSTPVPLLMPLLVDEVLLKKPGFLIEHINLFMGESESYVYVAIILVVVLILRFLFFILNVFQNWLFSVISKNITFKIRKDLLSHLSRVCLSEYETFGTGKISSLFLVDLDTIDSFLGVTVSRLIISLLTMLGVGIILLMIHWQLALFILFMNPFVVLITTKLARKVSSYKKEENKAYEIFTDALNETLDLFWQVRASNQEKGFMDRLKDKAGGIKNASISFSYKSDAASRFSFYIFLSGFEIFRAASILVVAYSDLSIGLMLAVFSYLWVMMSPIQEILNIQYAYHNAQRSIERINRIFAFSKEPDFPHDKNPFKDTLTNSVTLNSVDFSYIEGKKVLEDINMNIKKGEKVAIVGASGSGKTTLAQVIVGFYPALSGELNFDGVDIKEIGLDIVRENVFLILQNPLLFNDTIKMNITLGKEIEDEKVLEALKTAQLADLVNDLDEGIYTMVGKNGIKLSGGQRQRLSIARMILQDPNVVIFDESTSALDIHTENNLFEALKEFLKEKTTIIIAHRLSTIRQADYIYMLDRGKIVEEGTSAFLIEKEGKFAKHISKEV